ncbi:hypothetical protein CCP1ISM_8550001 [Azospirillaceae bacterium]
MIRKTLETDEEDARRLTERQRVAAVAGSVQAHYVDQHLSAASLVECSTARACIEAMRQQTADMALLPMLNALPFLHQPDLDQLKLGPLITHPALKGTVHIAVPKDRPDIKERVDAVIAELVADGTQKRLSRRYLPFDFY